MSLTMARSDAARRPGFHRARRPLLTGLAMIATAAALLAGCGGDDGSNPEPAAGTESSGDAGAGPGAGPDAAPDSPPSRLEEPLEGGERVVFNGDSLPVTTPPTYADLLPAKLAGKAPGLEVVNLAEPGTTSSDWLPGSERFESRLEPELAGADVVVVTVGGNDLQAELGGVDGLDALSRAGSVEALGGFAEVRAELERALTRTFRRIRALAPEARIVYVAYPDYSRAEAWRKQGGRLGALALRLGLGELLGAAAAARPDAIVDMLAVTGRRDVDALLADPEHLGPAGHELYARRLARALSG
jgi:lysophospholipase L1-like esterase